MDPRELERQLSLPTGEAGLEVARMMHENNIGMTRNTLEFLDLRDGHVVLEPGHGNAGHLAELLTKAKNLHYHGLELSETMHREAQRINRTLAGLYPVNFRLYDGTRMPYEDTTFDRIFTVNTLYFWKDPVYMASEIRRVLKRDGYAVITYAQRDFMEKLPFVGDIFRLYSDDDLRQLARDAGLEVVGTAHRTEQVKTKTEELVDRTFSMAKVAKR